MSVNLFGVSRGAGRRGGCAPSSAGWLRGVPAAETVHAQRPGILLGEDVQPSNEELHAASRFLDGVDEAMSWLITASGSQRRADEVLGHVLQVRRHEVTLQRAFGAPK